MKVINIDELQADNAQKIALLQQSIADIDTNFLNDIGDATCADATTATSPKTPQWVWVLSTFNIVLATFCCWAVYAERL